MKKLLLSIVTALLLVSTTLGLIGCNSQVSFKLNFVVDDEIVSTVDTNGGEIISLPDNPTKAGYNFVAWYWDKDTWTRPFTANSLLNEPLKADMSVYAYFTLEHTHAYDQEVATSTYLKTPATCTSKAVYYKSCTCGECGTATFEYGEKIPHTYDQEVATSTYLKTPATCTSKAVYYKSCTCGECGTVTFEYGEPLGHAYTNYVNDNNATCIQDGTKTAHCDHEGCTETHTITDTGSALGHIDNNGICTRCNESIEYLDQLDNGNYYGKVFNATTSFDFNNKLTTDNGVYVLYYDSAYTNEVINNVVTQINVGDNTYYVLFENGSSCTITLYRRHIYTVTFDVNGGSRAVPSQQVEEDRLATIPTTFTVRYGYTFDKWDFDFDTPIVDNTTIKALWKGNDKTYTVEYYLENFEDDNYTLTHTDTLDSVSGANVMAELTNLTFVDYVKYEHDGSDVSAVVNTDNSTVIKVYFKYKRYTISTTSNNTNAGTITDISGTYKYGKGLSLSATPNAGYTLDWYLGDTLVTSNDIVIDSNKSYIAKFTANTDTAYTVEYYQENIDDNNYTKIDTLTLSGITDTTANAEQKTYTGFTLNTNSSTLSGNIAGDGSLVLKVYYTRNTYTISTTSNNTNAGTFTNISGTYRYGKQLTLSATTYLAGVWQGWYNGDTLVTTDLSFDMSVSRDMSYTAKWETAEGLEDFYFTTDKTTCTITGVKDTTKTSYIIPDCVTSIGNHVFERCKLSSITIPDSVTSIGEEAFLNCTSLNAVYISDISKWCSISFDVNKWALFGSANPLSYAHNLYLNGELVTDLIIPDSLTSIGDYAFYGCTSLSSITIPDSVTSIGSSAFCSCYSLTNITIPESVTSIGNGVFYGCNSLRDVTIPDSVTSIGNNVFYCCPRLSKVYYKGGVDKWNGISIGNGNDNITSATRYYYSETEPIDYTYKYWHYDTDGVTIIEWN